MARILLVDDNPDLAALLAGALAERGHEATSLGRGREAISAITRGGFDAALVDLLLPDVRGTLVLEALRERGVPAVAMSGVFRGPRFVEEVRLAGGRALFEKPFDLRALLDAVEDLLGEPSPRPAPPLAEAPELTLTEVVDDGESAPPPASAPRPMLDDLPFSGRRVWNQARPMSAPMARPALLGPGAGRLTGTTVPRLLTAAHQGRAQGELRLQRGPVIKVIWLAEGRPIYAASNLASERFGRYAVERGAIAAADLATIQELAQREQVRTGEAMVQLGLLEPDRRLELLHDQAQRILWSTFDWVEGGYQFVGRRVGRPEVVPLRLAIPALVLRGLARLPLVRLRERLAADRVLAPTADPAFEFQELELSDAQARLLMSADGTKTREDLVALTDLEEREALSLLLGLQELRVLEPRADPRTRKIVLI